MCSDFLYLPQLLASRAIRQAAEEALRHDGAHQPHSYGPLNGVEGIALVGRGEGQENLRWEEVKDLPEQGEGRLQGGYAENVDVVRRPCGVHCSARRAAHSLRSGTRAASISILRGPAFGQSRSAGVLDAEAEVRHLLQIRQDAVRLKLLPVDHSAQDNADIARDTRCGAAALLMLARQGPCA
eukprot:scaffold442_cov268-Pinguiococcus_pyrenoidosus.AAC.21